MRSHGAGFGAIRSLNQPFLRRTNAMPICEVIARPHRHSAALLHAWMRSVIQVIQVIQVVQPVHPLRVMMAVVASLLLASGQAWAQDPVADKLVIEGHALDRKLRLAGSELQLNGTGWRSVATFKGYLAALYLPRRASSAAEVLAQPGPNRLRLVMWQSAPAAEFIKAVEKGVLRNTPLPDGERQLRAPLEQLAQQFQLAQRVRKGDVVDLDFDGPRGLRFALNGRAMGPAIESADFQQALLLAFIGQRPYQKDMRAGLLGHTGEPR